MKENNEKGAILVGVLVILAVSLIISSGMLDSANSNMKTRSFVKTRSDQYYKVEATLNKVLAWLQDNSRTITSGFESGQFTTNFTKGNPTFGDNEGAFFQVPTMVKLAGTNDSAMLSNNAFFGASAFPTLTNPGTGASWDAVTDFAAADLGEANARVVMMWARESNGSHEPIFRVDVVTGNNPDRGVHSFSFVYSELVGGGATPGFYGRDFYTSQSPNNTCDSYDWTHNGSTWVRGAPKANCPVATDGPLNTSANISGTGSTLQDPGISLNPPSGNFTGTECEGSGCHSYTLPVLNTWAGYCPGVTTDLYVGSDQSIPAGCYRDITIANNRTLEMSDFSAPYYIRNLTHAGNKAKVDFGSIPTIEKVQIYVEEVYMNAQGHVNGNKIIGTNNAPHQMEWYYLGTGAVTLQLNGTTDMYGLIVAPNADVVVNGNFDFYGGILAKSLNVIGNATLHYDERLGVTTVPDDLNFSIKKASQRYR